MVFKESETSFSVLSTPRASGLLQNKESTRYISTKAKKAKMKSPSIATLTEKIASTRISSA